MKYYDGLSVALTGAAIVMIQAYSAAALTANEVNQIASEITVLIDGINPGSGVMIAREGNTYSVLTAKHVVETEDEYAIVTSDGQRHPLNYRTVKKLPGVDLAILQFSSDKNYRVATVADYDYDARFRYVFVSGWPSSTAANPQKKRLFNAGLLISNDYKFAFINNPVSQGYELFYTNITEEGMSGAPVLDTKGRVIGIHGQSEGEKFYDEKSREIARVKLGFSSGIPINTFLKATQQLKILLKLKVERDLPTQLTRQESRSIEAFLRVPPPTDSSNPVDWANRGNELYRLERFEEALAAFERAIKIKPDFYPAWYGKGNVLSSLERYEQAIAAYDRATQLKPDFYLAWRDRGAMLAFLKRYQEALASFDKAILGKPNDYVAWYIRGDLLAVNMQQYPQAIAAYERVIAIKSDFAPAWTGKAEALYELKRYQEAIAALDQAIQIEPQQVAAWTLKGTILLAWERYSEALSAYERGVEFAPNDPQLWMLRAAALVGLNREQEARKSAQQALRLKPNDPDILNFINAIGKPGAEPGATHPLPNRRRDENSHPANPTPGWLW